MILWIYGRSGSGKTTIANAIKKDNKVRNEYDNIIHIDGDDIRDCVENYNYKNRDLHLKYIACLIKKFNNNRNLIICSFITPLQKQREWIKKITDCFFVFMSCNKRTLVKRDTKKLYNQTKYDPWECFEVSEENDCVLDSDNLSVSECVSILRRCL